MSTVTVPQVNPNDEVTALSVNQGPNAIAAVLNGNVDDANISTISGTKISSGTLPASALDTNANPETREDETTGDVVASGLIWSSLTGLNGAMSSGVAYVNGKRLAVSAIATNAFTASRDTYIYVDNAGAIQYSIQTNGAAQPATGANTQLIAKVITSGAAITSISDYRATGLGSAFNAYTPTLTGITIGNGTVAGLSKVIGGLVFVDVTITFGSTTAVTGAVSISLPFPAMSRYGSTFSTVDGVSALNDTGVATYTGLIFFNNSTLNANVRVTNASSTYATSTELSSTVPFTWGTGDSIQAKFAYERAI